MRVPVTHEFGQNVAPVCCQISKWIAGNSTTAGRLRDTPTCQIEGFEQSF